MRALSALLLLSIVACGPLAGEAGRIAGTGESVSRYQAGTGDVTADLSVRVERGTVEFRIIDPSMRIRYRSGVLTVGSARDDVLRFPGMRGEWQLVFELQDAEGTYKVDWGS
jgi:hypothetical protein